MPVRRVNGTSLYYEVAGRGTPLLFIHGHGLTHDMFRPQYEFFSEAYQVIAVDLRGNGLSGKLDAAPQQTIDIQCRDLSLLLGFLGVARAVVVGADYGGILAQRFAFLYPDQVHAMIIADSLCNNMTTTLIGKTMYALSVIAKLSCYLPGDMFTRSLKIAYGRWELAYRTVRNGMLRKRANELFIQSMATSQIDYTALLPRIRVPVFCIAGDQAEADVRRMREMARLLPHGRFAAIQDCFHPSNLCQPERFNELVRQFLEHHQPAGPAVRT